MRDHVRRDQVGHSIRRRATAALGAGLSVGLVLGAGTTAPATADGVTGASAAKAARADGLGNFGYRGDVYGVKLVTDSVEALDLKDAHAQQLCTRAVGKVVEADSIVSVPDNPLINVSASTSRTETYVDGPTHGVRGTNTIGDISIGGRSVRSPPRSWSSRGCARRPTPSTPRRATGTTRASPSRASR